MIAVAAAFVVVFIVLH